jgi:hypothetical protein
LDNTGFTAESKSTEGASAAHRDAAIETAITIVRGFSALPPAPNGLLFYNTSENGV